MLKIVAAALALLLGLAAFRFYLGWHTPAAPATPPEPSQSEYRSYRRKRLTKDPTPVPSNPIQYGNDVAPILR